MAAKPRVNLRIRQDLWDGAAREAKRSGTDRTAVVELALARHLGLPEDLAANGRPAVSGKRRVEPFQRGKR